MVRARAWPPEWKKWMAMLAMKKDEDPARDLTRRQDLWVTCHGQKIVMRMMNERTKRRHAPPHPWRKQDRHLGVPHRNRR